MKIFYTKSLFFSMLGLVNIVFEDGKKWCVIKEDVRNPTSVIKPFNSKQEASTAFWQAHYQTLENGWKEGFRTVKVCHG